MRVAAALDRLVDESDLDISARTRLWVGRVGSFEVVVESSGNKLMHSKLGGGGFPDAKALARRILSMATSS